MLTVLALGAGAGMVATVALSAAPGVSAAHVGTENIQAKIITALIAPRVKNAAVFNGQTPKILGRTTAILPLLSSSRWYGANHLILFKTELARRCSACLIKVFIIYILSSKCRTRLLVMVINF
jgi:hypothetical protein